MASEAELEEKFWKALKSDMVVMLGLDREGQHAQPMTAQLEGEAKRGPIWFFTAKGTDLSQQLGDHNPAMLQFVAKDHGLFACVSGELRHERDRATIDRLWNPFVAAWFEGKDDPKLELLRFEPHEAQIWLNENSLFAGVKILLGRDPKQEYAGKTADVRLS